MKQKLYVKKGLIVITLLDLARHLPSFGLISNYSHCNNDSNMKWIECVRVCAFRYVSYLYAYLRKVFQQSHFNLALFLLLGLCYRNLTIWKQYNKHRCSALMTSFISDLISYIIERNWNQYPKPWTQFGLGI